MKKIVYQSKFFNLPINLDFFIVTFIIVISFAVSFSSITQYRNAGGKMSFYQSLFEPAVMIACNKEFGARIFGPSNSMLDDFLNVKINKFECNSLPNNLTLTDKIAQKAWYYLIGTVGIWWRLTGNISWSSLDGLVALLFAISVGLSYGIFRLGIGPSIASICSLFFASIPLHLGYLPFLRDYGKIPFILAAIFILGLIVKIPFKNYVLVSIAGIYGLVVGIGYGFRPDLLLMIPLGIVVLICFTWGSSISRIMAKLFSVGVMLVVFSITITPIMESNARGSCTFHFPILGLMQPFQDPLGVSPSIYHFGHQFNDALVATMTQTHGTNFLNLNEVGFCDASYDIASSSLYFNILKTFPADIIIRGYASTLKILHFGFDPVSNVMPNGLDNYYNIVSSFFKKIRKFSLLLSAIVFIIVSRINVRYGLFLFFVVLYLSMYPAIQFDSRHFVHLYIVSLWIAGFLIYHAIKFISQKLQNITLSPNMILNMKMTQPLMLYACLCLILYSVLLFSRWYQTNNVNNLIAHYKSAAKEQLYLHFSQNQPDTLVMFDPWEKSKYLPKYGRMIMLEFSSGDKATTIPITLEYHYESLGHNFAQKIIVQVNPSGESTYVYIPSYRSMKLFKVKGISLANDHVNFLKNVYVVSGLDNYPTLITLHLHPNWKSEKLYEQKIKYF